MDEEALRQAYGARLEVPKATAVALEEKVCDDLAGIDHVDRVSFRAKELDSFAEKVLSRRVEPPYIHPLTEVEDQIAGRILVFFRSDIDIVRNRLEEVFSPVESSRREPQKDAEFGYESHHTVCVIPIEVKPNEWSDLSDMPNTFELQIRTLCMHAWAEPQHDIDYKSADDLSRDDRRELAWIAASIWGADHAFERVMKRRTNTPADGDDAA